MLPVMMLTFFSCIFRALSFFSNKTEKNDMWLRQPRQLLGSPGQVAGSLKGLRLSH
jgi:hypothetical protein